jgi:hypothetical protein
MENGTKPNIPHRNLTVISRQTLDRVIHALVNLVSGKRFLTALHHRPMIEGGSARGV